MFSKRHTHNLWHSLPVYLAKGYYRQRSNNYRMIIERKFLFTSHIESKGRLYMLSGNAAVLLALLGTIPKTIKCIYTAIFRTSLCFASLLRWHIGTIGYQFQKVQRLLAVSRVQLIQLSMIL